MVINLSSTHAVDRDVEAFVRERIDDAAHQRLTELLLGSDVEALYRVADRGGVGILVTRTGALREQDIVKLLKYRLAQYLAVGMIDARPLCAAGLEHGPLSSIAADHVHIIAGSSDWRDSLLPHAARVERRSARCYPAHPRPTAFSGGADLWVGNLQPAPHPP